MRVPVELLGFGFWLFFLNCARCQECLRENIKYENTEPAEKASYADGETVKVICVTGYTGFNKLKCVKGEWKKTTGRPCAKKKCNHPGDTPNGDFELTDGTEFVFGVTVVYKCNKGYEMTSRINQRTCRAQGWDNAVPVCEVVKCPPIRTDEEVTASGNTEDGSYGDVIRFECVSSDKMIDGSSEIHCQETGEWSDVVPKCKDITCTAPVIPNGYVVDSQREYKKDAPLKYKCNETFKPREGIPRCAKFGWTVKPECDEVNCVLKSTTYGVKMIIPYGKTIFRARESVEITCSEKYWFFGPKETKKTFTCKDDGEWDYVPVCAEITCETPYDQHVYSPYYYFSGDKKLGVKRSYRCESGYRPTEAEAEATCTRDGWTPNPLCAEIMCAAPNIPNAEIDGGQREKYKIKSRIQYKCRSGFEPEKSVQITCDSQGQWRGIQQCSAMCAAPNITNAEIDGPQRSYYTIYSRIQYRCLPGFEPEESVQITCDREGQWRDIQQCATMCAAPNITNAEIEGGQRSYYTIYSRIQYKCLPGFEPEESVQITCDREGQWRGIQQCTEMSKLCRESKLENGFIHINSSNKEEIFYSCDPGYKPFSGNWWGSVTCTKGSQFEEPRCIREEECGALPSVHHGKLTLRDPETADVECDPGFMSTERSIKCTNGRWEKPVCKKAVRCGIPPNVTNAVITSKPEEFYLPRSTVTYVCRSLYLIRGESTVSCCNGKWEKTPTCQEVTCPLQQNTTQDLNIDGVPDIEGSARPGHKLNFSCTGQDMILKGQREITCQSNGQWSSPFPTCEEVTCPLQENTTQDLNIDGVPDIEGSARPGHTLNFSCTGQDMILKGQREITCQSNGQWSSPFPTCEVQTTSCGPPPDVNDADTIELKKDEYTTGERVEYRCFSKYKLDLRPPFSRFLTCDQGEWRGNIKCLKVTCPLQENTTQDLNIDGVPDIEGSARPGHKLNFSCTGQDMILKGQREITCQSNGQWSSPFPTCEGQTTSCGPPPDVNDADTIELKKDEYTTGERVEYSCFSKYTLDQRPPFSTFLTCDQGEWRGNIKCLKPCTVTLEEMERRGIELAYGHPQKMFAPDNDYISFACKRGKVSGGVPLRQQCNDGVMTLPVCVRDRENK